MTLSATAQLHSLSKPEITSEPFSKIDIQLFDRLYALLKPEKGREDPELQLLCLKVLALEHPQTAILASILALFNYYSIDTPLDSLVTSDLKIDRKTLAFSLECGAAMSKMSPRKSRDFFLSKLGDFICENEDFWKGDRILMLEIYTKFSKEPLGENKILMALCYVALHVPCYNHHQIATNALCSFLPAETFSRNYKCMPHPLHWWRELTNPSFSIFHQMYQPWIPSMNIVGEFDVLNVTTLKKIRAYIVKEFRVNKVLPKKFNVVILPSRESLGDLTLYSHSYTPFPVSQIIVQGVYSYFSAHNFESSTTKIYKYVGTALIQIACEYAQRKKASSIYLESLIEAVPFYEKMGFNRFEPKAEDAEDEGISNVDMQLDLTALMSWASKIISHPVLYKTARMQLKG